MGRKLGVLAVLLFGGSPSNRMWPGRSPTSVPSGILIHPAVWLQYMGPKVGGCCAPFFGGGGAGTPSNTMSPGWSTSIVSGILIHSAIWPQQIKIGGCAPLGELGSYLTQCGRGQGLPPCQVSSWFIQPFGHNTPTLQTDRENRTDEGPISWGEPFYKCSLKNLDNKNVLRRLQNELYVSKQWSSSGREDVIGPLGKQLPRNWSLIVHKNACKICSTTMDSNVSCYHTFCVFILCSEKRCWWLFTVYRYICWWSMIVLHDSWNPTCTRKHWLVKWRVNHFITSVCLHLIQSWRLPVERWVELCNAAVSPQNCRHR